MSQRNSRWVGGVLLVLLSVFYLAHLYRERDRSLWDFKTYYHAAVAFRTGEDPYDPAVLSRIAGETITLPYLYPPHTLAFFVPFTVADYPTAFQFYLGLKILALISLFFLWRKFLAEDFDYWFLPFALVVFNSAVPLDLGAGNISVFEQLFLWSGFLAYLRGRLLVFALLTVATALFKLTPLFFLGLLILTSGRKRWDCLFAGVGVFAVVQTASRLLLPGMGEDFTGQVNRLLADPDSRGLWNPSTFALVRDLLHRGAIALGGGIRTPVVMTAFALTAAALVGLTLRRLRQPITDRGRIILFCLLYILLVPRLQVYSYLILIPPAFLLVRDAARRWAYPIVLFCIMSLSAKDVFFPGMKEFYSFFWDYSPWMIAFALWVYAVATPSEPSPDADQASKA